MDLLARRQREGAHNYTNGANGYQQRPSYNGYKISHDQRSSDNTNDQLRNNVEEKHEWKPAEVVKEAYDQQNDKIEKTDLYATSKMETPQHVDQQQTDKIFLQEVSCCTICGGPLAVKILRQSYHPASGRLIYEWTAQKRGLPPWLYKKTYLALSVKKLRENAG